MSDRKTRKYIAAAAAVIMAVCVPVHPVPAAADKSVPVSEPEANLNAEPEKAAGEITFATSRVERGTLSVEAQAEGTLQYYGWDNINFDTGYDSAIFIKYCVAVGDYVEEGQPIAEFKALVNDIDIKTVDLRLTRAREEQKEVQESCGARLASAERAVKESTGTALRIAELDLEKCRMETERSIRTVNEKVAELEELVDKYQREQEKLVLPAPMSGYIYSLENKEPDMLAWNGDTLGLMCKQKTQIFAVPDGSGILLYGMNTLVANNDLEADTLGKVVSCSKKYLSGSFQSNDSYIWIDKSNSSYRASIRYETLHLDNVLMVSVEAVKSDSGGCYVTELKDGKKIKHYFLMGKRTKEYCHVIDGLTEGMVVLIN